MFCISASLAIISIVQRIANAVMGLESLISDKSAELNYLFSMKLSLTVRGSLVRAQPQEQSLTNKWDFFI